MSGFTVSSTVEAVAIGNFDGMHLGHQALFARVGEKGGIVVIEHYRANLTPGVYRAAFTDSPLFFYDFDLIRALSPEAFIEMLKADFPCLRKIVVGEDFLFGAGRSADVHRLAALFDGEVEVVAEVHVGKQPVHSRFIREMIAEGRMADANALLGHTYRIWGEVVTGQGLGAKSLVPTLNVKSGRFLLPAAGVYKTDTFIANSSYPSVTFVGHRFTTDGRFAVETHLIDCNLHGKPRPWEVSIAWHKRLRTNRRFDSLEALKAQIEKDIGEARER
ncbi:bifunctional riboflavin kinase/FAD synthetase [Hydrogenimonas urashimensis]|uniref:bifunctional riboflavin kinase/FAD synthetase n=1 Tax=Hydrogenimonas urashimensis TaxID=2740515 RepID=UPI001EFFB184|nr:bifunctional riboflavin kinase/FAD synthetase [Hydrogenimonas urashimensis]